MNSFNSLLTIHNHLSNEQLEDYKKAIQKTIELLRHQAFRSFGSMSMITTISDLQLQITLIDKELDERANDESTMKYLLSKGRSLVGLPTLLCMESNPQDEPDDIEQRITRIEKQVSDFRNEFHEDMEKLEPAREICDIVKSLAADSKDKENDE